MVLAGAATVKFNNNNQTFGSLAGNSSSSIQLGSATLTTGGDNSNSTFAGNISGTGGVAKTGSGDFTMTGANNTYSGATTISAGTLTLNGMLTGTGAAVTLSGANVTLNGNGAISGTGREVVVNALGDTIGATGGGLSITNPDATGILLNPGSSARVLGNTITGNRIGIDVYGATAFIQGNTLSNNTGAGTDGVSYAAGLCAGTPARPVRWLMRAR